MAKSFDKAPEMQIDPKKSYMAIMETDKGSINLELFADRAPITVNNFVFLSRQGFYDDLIFHRVISNFMIQGGCPNGDGRGGPGYRWNDEPSALQIKHETGSLSMANAGRNTNGSQFFITHAPQPHLNGNHAVFGKVKSQADQDVVDAIEAYDRIKKVTIVES